MSCEFLIFSSGMTQLKTQNSKRKTAPPHGVVLLGSGASSQMGRPKLLLPWGATTIVGHRTENPQPERGMFTSILCAAHSDGWRKEISTWVVVLGHQLHLRAETLRLLLKQGAQHPAAICQPEFQGRARHPVLLPRLALDELKQSQAQTLNEFLKQTSCQLDKCSIEDSGLSFDLDRPEYFEKAIKSH